MALPAGRYGVTKNQLLKIKKLPMNTIKLIEELTEKFDLLGTAAFKNSTSVVTESSDLVESGAVKDIVGWGNKNLLDLSNSGFIDETNVIASKNDGVVTFTNNANSDDYYRVMAPIDIPDSGEYILSGCPANGSTSIYFMYIQASDFSETYRDVGDGVTCQLDKTKTYNCYIKLSSGYGDGKVFYPMLRKAGTSDTFEPYHASVEESLAEKCDNTVIAPVENGSTASQAYAVGEHFIRDGAFCTCKQAISQGGSFTLGTNYTSGDVANNLVYKAGDSITFDNLMFHLASCNNTGTTIYVYIPLNKPVVASSATSNFTTIVVRNGSSNYSESITVTDISIKSQGIFLGLGSTSAVGNINSVLSVALVGTVTFS